MEKRNYYNLITADNNCKIAYRNKKFPYDYTHYQMKFFFQQLSFVATATTIQLQQTQKQLHSKTNRYYCKLKYKHTDVDRYIMKINTNKYIKLECLEKKKGF